MYQQSNTFSSVVKTLLYSSLFHFPLSYDELWRFIIGEKSITKNELYELLQRENAIIKNKDNYYFLKGEDDSVLKRQKERINYDRKLCIAQHVARLLSYLPSILFIGMSGSLAAGSASKDADIDFFIITSPSTVWVTRFFCVVLLSITGWKRQRGVLKAPDKICLNSFIDYRNMDYFHGSQDIYTAHEIAQLYPLFNRTNTYEKFLKTNDWYLDILPNAGPKSSLLQLNTSSKFINGLLQWINPICAFLQIVYMKKYRTKEVINDGVILLHPHDYKGEIIKRYTHKLIEYDLLTKE